VCEAVAGQPGQRWSLGVRPAAAGVSSGRAPGRGADVPQGHGAQGRQALGAVGRVCDRDRASQSRAKDEDARLLASCWAPGRRALLPAARRGPARERWRCTWGDDLRARSRLQAARLEPWATGGPLAQQASAWAQSPRAWERPRRQRRERGAAPLHASALPLGTQTGLRRRPHPWDGLTVWGARPAGALDQNTAERVRRTPGGGRQHSDGAGRVGSAH
jgi:hypothetical protein